MTATTIQEIVDLFAERLAATEGAVVTYSQYRHNGGIAHWTAPIVPQDGLSVDLIDENGEPIWDAAEISEDGLSLKLSRTPRSGVHVYEEWTISDAADYAAELLAAFAGTDGIDSLSSLRDFSDWLEADMGLEEGSDGHNAAMVVALDSLKRKYQ